jgi:hypothetical protein
MSWVDTVKEAFRRTTPKAIPSTAVLTMQERGKIAKANVQLFRHWAEHSEWVRAAVSIRKSQVSAAEWDIVPFDPEKNYSRELAKKVKNLFDMPNPANDSFRSFVEPVIEDLLVLDAGVVEKVRTLRGEPVQLWPVDGGTVRVSSIWDGSSDKEARYFWYPDGYLRAQFTNDDMIYMMANPSTYRPMGLSPLETLKLAIDSELSGHSFNHRQVINAAPDGMLDLGEGARPEQVEDFKSYWGSEVAGKGAICAVFGLSPQDLGLTFDVNRSSGQVQQENTEDRGIRPVLSLLQDYFTREIVWDDAFGGIDNNLAFRFTHLNLRETLSQAKVMEIQLAGVPWRSVNEVRKEQGLEPWSDEFDTPMMVTPTGAVRLDQVPTAREVLENNKKPTPEDKPPSGGDKTKQPEPAAKA